VEKGFKEPSNEEADRTLLHSLLKMDKTLNMIMCILMHLAWEQYIILKFC